MTGFAYNNDKNPSTGHTSFEINCGYYPRVLFKEDVNPYSRSCSADELAEELRELMKVCYYNLLHAQELQKKAHHKRVKSHSYAPDEKLWLNSKYIKTKRNKKLENKFFRPFQVLHKVGKQVYKLKLPTRWKLYNVFHISLLEQNIIKKKQVNNTLPKSENFEIGDDKEYEVEAIIDSAVYGKEANNQMPSLYYLILWKGYLEKKSTWEPSTAVMQL